MCACLNQCVYMLSHLEDVNVYVGQGEHSPGEQHTEEGAVKTLEPRDMDQQPVLSIQPQEHHQDCPQGLAHRVVLQLTCRTHTDRWGGGGSFEW